MSAPGFPGVRIRYAVFVDPYPGDETGYVVALHEWGGHWQIREHHLRQGAPHRTVYRYHQGRATAVRAHIRREWRRIVGSELPDEAFGTERGRAS
jgi:hypothetical protein